MTRNLQASSTATAEAVEPTQFIPDFAGSDEHPVLQIPFTVLMDGRSYDGVGLSLVSAFASGLAARQLEGKRRLATLRFAFDGFKIDLPIEVRVTSISSETGLLALRFTQPTGPHLPQLRYLLNAYVAGELVEMSGLLAATREPGNRSHANPRSGVAPRKLLRTFVNICLMLAATALLAAIATRVIHERFFVVRADGFSTVGAEGLAMRAISSGQIDFIDIDAKKGEPLFNIRSTSGGVFTVTMPCDCRVIPGNVPVGSTVLAGDAILQVASRDAKPVVRTILNPDALHLLSAGATAEIRLSDGRLVFAGFDDAHFAATAVSSSGGREVTLIPDAGLSNSDLGKPVSVRIVSDPLKSLRAGLANIRRRALGIRQ
jgi:alginate biosynthesis protein Alg44